jgi:hypothetical protein
VGSVIGGTVDVPVGRYSNQRAAGEAIEVEESGRGAGVHPRPRAAAVRGLEDEGAFEIGDDDEVLRAQNHGVPRIGEGPGKKALRPADAAVHALPEVEIAQMKTC